MCQERFQEPAGQRSRDAPVKIVLTGARSAFIGRNLMLEPYRTAVTTIVVGLEENVTAKLIEAENEETQSDPVIILPPNTVCDLQASGDIAMIFCDAMSDDCSQIDLRTLSGQKESLRSLLKAGPGQGAPGAFLGEVFSLVGVSSDRYTRPEIQRVVHAIGRQPEEYDTVEKAAALAELSPMRFQHVFSETVGVPFRKYRQWRRMGQIVRAMADGESLTSAAYGAGFSNSAHLSTAFKAMFGLTPSMLFDRRVEYFLSESGFDMANESAGTGVSELSRDQL